MLLKHSTCMNTPEQSRPGYSSCLHDLWRWNRQGVPKRRNIKLRSRGTAPKDRIQHSEHDECLKSRINIKNLVNLLVIRCKYLQNARYAQVKIKLFFFLSKLCPVPYTGFLISQYIW